MAGSRRAGSGWRGRLAALLLAGWAAAGTATGQQQNASGERTAVVVALLPHLRGLVPAGAAALDPEQFCESRLVGWRCPPPIAARAQELDFSLNSREFTLVCLGGPAYCRLVNVRSLVWVELLTVDGRVGRAEAIANLWWRTGDERSPVGRRRVRVSLTRADGAWRVTGRGP